MMSIEEWLATNVSNLEIATNQLTKIQELIPDLYDFETTITVNGRKFHGRGTKSDEDLAVTVSLVESLERVIVRHSNISTTNGVAAHNIKWQAEEKSLFELIERDLFLSHFLTKTPFTPLQQSKVISQKAKNYISDNSDKLSFYKMRQTNFGTGYICLISGESRWGGIFGLSFGNENQSDLIQSAFLEAFRQYSYLRSSNLLDHSLSLEDFYNLKTWSFKSHALLSRNLDYFKSISDLFAEKNESNHIVAYDKSEFKFKELKSGIAPFSSLPIYVIQCTSLNCQNLYTGLATKESISKAGLKRFLGFEPLELNLLPHPLS